MSGPAAKQITATSTVKETPMSFSQSTFRHRSGLVAALLLSMALFAATVGVAPASAEFGVKKFEQRYSAQDATPGKPADDPMETQAGAHPFSVTTYFELNFTEIGFFQWIPDAQVKNMFVELAKGFSGDATAIPRCSLADFNTKVGSPTGTNNPACPISTVIGVGGISLFFPPPFVYFNVPIFNLEPPPGVPVRLGFEIAGAPQVIDVGVKAGGDYNVTAVADRVSQAIVVFGAAIQLWGVPADPAHNPLRGANCLQATEPVSEGEVDFAAGSVGSCSAGVAPKPFLNLPTGCNGPVETRYRTDAWINPGVFVEGGALSYDNATPPNPQGFTGCGKLGFDPSLEAEPTSDSAETGTGMDVTVDFNDEGLKNPEGLTQSTVEKAVVTLPEGVTVNPSIGEGLGVCTPADVDRETLSSKPGEGCPNSSKIGTLHLESPLVDEGFDGSVYLAKQDDPNTTTPGAENPFDSLIALYLVLRNTNLGVLVKLPLKVEPDPETGQLVSTLEDIPQIPFSHFNFHFREGQRAPLVTPSACGTYTTEAKFYPWSNPDNPKTVTSDFQITEGIGDGPCPPGGVPPFDPSYEAGSLNNNAGSFTPFNMRLIREDGEQDLTKFSSILPPGVLGSLAGVSKCSDAAVAAAKGKTGREELAAPSCPANSQIGTTLAGAGVGSALTYVGGQIYLAGPYKGAPLSVISVTPAVAGPFDAGTVVVRLGLTLNPKTAEVEVDGAASDPIPHILKGIVLKVRDLRVYVDRPNFILNPTSCDPSSAKATLFGSFLDVFSPADDVPVDLATRFQAANCLNLGFKPRLNLRLTGGTKRGDHPGLRAVYRPRPGDANIEGLVVRLPRSAFLDQAHIRTICTRVQFAAESCPKGAQYGFIRAWTPLLDTPLEGPAYLRSSDNKLPDLVFDLQGLVDVEVSTRIDSQRGGIRATLETAPDAPISLVVLKMQGGKKGLIVNSRDLCIRKSRANIRMSGHNGKRRTINPVMRAACKAKSSRAKRAGR